MKATSKDTLSANNMMLALPLFFVVGLWFVFWLELQMDTRFTNWAIVPRELSGIKGILGSTFIHSDLKHLANNSISLLVLLTALGYFYPEHALRIVFFGIVFSGLLTWGIGRQALHLGASNLVYVLVSFIFFKGIQTQYYRLVALSLGVVLLYGSSVWYMFPGVEEEISWEGHLSGFLSGLGMVFLVKKPSYVPYYTYDWEHPNFDPSNDAFMKHFDENGNFVPRIQANTTPDYSSCHASLPVTVVYFYVAKPKENA